MSNPQESSTPGFTQHFLSPECSLELSSIPDSLVLQGVQFEELWNLRPLEFRRIVIHGREVAIPRWQSAYGRNYIFSGQVATGEEIPPILTPFLNWAKMHVDTRMNGLLLNWYDGKLGHYIGAHHDETKQLWPGTKIVTISLGDERIFRMTREETRDHKRCIVETRDFPIPAGSVVVIPWETNLQWKHSVPKFARFTGRRVSITLRAFRQ